MFSPARYRSEIVVRPSGEILYDAAGHPISGATSHTVGVFVTGAAMGAFFGYVAGFFVGESYR